MKENRVDNDCDGLSGIRYKVVPSSFILRWMYDYIPFFPPIRKQSFDNLKEAKRCANLKSTGRWKYTKSKEIIS